MDDQVDDHHADFGGDYDGPIPYNFEPVRQPRPVSVRPSYQQEMEVWSQDNLWQGNYHGMLNSANTPL